MSRTVCDHGRPEGEACDICEALGKAQWEIHRKDILHAAWLRVREVPVIKSMHPATREDIMRALLG